MKREGRQHGMVRAYETFSARPKSRIINEFSGPATAGRFTKVPSKPTNHSKFTGGCGRPRCRCCHIAPACKAEHKVKGAIKMRSSSDVVSNYRLIAWRVVDHAPGFKFSGFSATGVLEYLDCEDHHDHDDDLDVEERLYDDEIYAHVVGIEEVDESDVNNDGVGVDDDDDDDRMSFCEVGIVWRQVDEDKSWCLVEEM